MTFEVRLALAGQDEKAAVEQLLEFNAYEHSSFDGADVARDGRFGYSYVDTYWSEPARYPYLVMVGRQIAGLVLVRTGPPHSIAEFLVLPKYRRSGVGTVAARTAFAQFPGEWEVRQVANNIGATEFWRRAIPVPFQEILNDDGTIQRFAIPH